MSQQYTWPSAATTLSGGTVSVSTGTLANVLNVGTVSNVAGGTVAISNLAAGSVAVTAGTVTVSGTPTVICGTLNVSGSTTSGTGAIVTQDVSGYQMVSVLITITGTATVTYKCSNDGVNYFSVAMGGPSTGATTTVASGNQMNFCPVGFRYFKVDVTSYSNGTVSAFVCCGPGQASDPALRQIQVTNQVQVVPLNGTITTINNVAAGTIAIQTGTIASLTNVAGGTVAISKINNSATATLTAVTGSTTSFQILAANTNRKGFTVFNSGSFTIYMTAGGTSGTTAGAYQVQIPINGYYEAPTPHIFSGSVTGIVSGTGGTITVVEYT